MFNSESKFWSMLAGIMILITLGMSGVTITRAWSLFGLFPQLEIDKYIYLGSFIIGIIIIFKFLRKKKTEPPKLSAIKKVEENIEKIQEKVKPIKPKRNIFWRILGKLFKIVFILMVLLIVGVIAIFFYQNNSGSEYSNKISNEDSISVNTIISASSVLPPDGSYIYDARLVADGSNSTAWVEGADDIGDYEWIKFDFSSKQKISQMSIVPGYASTNSAYFKNNRVKKFRLEFSDGSKDEFSLPDKMTTHSVMFDSVNVDYVRLVILDVYRGSTYNDTAIAELSFK